MLVVAVSGGHDHLSLQLLVGMDVAIAVLQLPVGMVAG